MAEIESAAQRSMRETQERTDSIKALQDKAPPPPSLQAICLEHTLYAKIQLNPERDVNFLDSIKYRSQQFDAHCVYCGKSSTFQTLDDRRPADLAQALQIENFNGSTKLQLKRLRLEGGQFALHLRCSRRPDHLYSYFFVYSERDGVLTKVGQTPSLEDVAGADIERYRKVLGDEFAELRKATGLFAHGIGIGAFVYLRRIFESLVEMARKAEDPSGEREAEFRHMRMAERIGALKDMLPPAVVQYKDAYSILSKGLHELGEEECKRHFPVIRAAVIMMLEQRYEAAEKAKVAADLERAIAAIASETKGA